MLKIDAHQHFWQFDPVRDSWINNDMAAIQHNFLPADLAPLLQQHDFDGCVAVQASQSEAETDFLLSLSRTTDIIKGIVGWVDLQADTITDRLQYYKQYSAIKGFRHVLQGEADRALMLKPAFIRGIAALQPFGFTYDILIYTDQLRFTRELVTAFPGQKFIIDHLAKPLIRQKEMEAWKQDIMAIAACPNVYCKLSGMVTEADWKHWQVSDFTPYLDVVVNAFGTDRIVYGSDWPVCLVAATYGEQLAILQQYFAQFSEDEKAKIFGGNAVNFYNL